MRLPSLVLAALVALSASPVALAQTPAAPGTVTVLATPPGSVLILRGGKTYQLRQGDAVYDGDQVFTRTNGATQFVFGGCNFRLNGEQSLVLKVPASCDAVPMTLAPVAFSVRAEKPAWLPPILKREPSSPWNPIR